MRKFEIVARTDFTVEVDESKFTPEFFAEFSSYMWHMDRVEDAVEHLADLFARGLIRGEKNEFVEGYGDIEALGVRFIIHNDTVRPVSADLRMEIDLTPVKEPEPA
jgi:hypothetical protein